jgi:hypothetical protein
MAKKLMQVQEQKQILRLRRRMTTNGKGKDNSRSLRDDNQKAGAKAEESEVFDYLALVLVSEPR